MTTFTDDFERADGALGSNWSVGHSALQIVSGRAKTTVSTYACCLAQTDSGPHDATLVCPNSVGADMNNLIYVKMTQTATQFYSGRVNTVSGVTVAQIYKSSLGAPPIGQAVVPVALGASITLRLVYSGGELFLYVNGTLRCQARDADFDANIYVGFATNNGASGIDSFSTATAETTRFFVAPSFTQADGPPITINLTAVGTAWTPGTPGSPSFTVSAGSLADQTVTSATSATAVFSPPATTQTVVVTDPSTSLTASIYCSTVFPPGGGGGQPFLSNTAIAYLENSAAAEEDALIANRNMEVDGTGATFDLQTAIGNLHLSAHNTSTTISGEPATAALIYTLWRLINGGYDPPTGPFTEPTSVPLAHALDFLRARWDSSVDPWTVEQLVAALGGDPLASHQDILTALDGLEVTFDDTAILEAIAGVKGDPLATIKAVLDYLFAMRTVSEWTLGNVKDWIEAVRGTDQPTIANVMAKLALIQAGNLPSLNDIDEHVSTMAAVIAAIELVTGDILDGVTELLSRSTAVAAGHPVWPGVGNATVDTPVSLSNGMTITGPFDGLIVTITDQPPAAGRYVFGAVSSWMHAGAVVFLTDDGQQERAQTFGLDEQILVPLTMMHADSAILRLNAGWVGTVAKWSVNA